jgi:hypothetical protein
MELLMRGCSMPTHGSKRHRTRHRSWVGSSSSGVACQLHHTDCSNVSHRHVQLGSLKYIHVSAALYTSATGIVASADLIPVLRDTILGNKTAVVGHQESAEV